MVPKVPFRWTQPRISSSSDPRRYSKGVTYLLIKQADLGWTLVNKILHPITSDKASVIAIDVLKDIPATPAQGISEGIVPTSTPLEPIGENPNVGGVDFLSLYLDLVWEGRLDRPRIPLVDIASAVQQLPDPVYPHSLQSAASSGLFLVVQDNRVPCSIEAPRTYHIQLSRTTNTNWLEKR
jgi:hypothetical protein